jgi:formiminotetrahydrofolate cyclodeaminase
LKNKSLKEFSDITASEEPVPGGGSVAAYSGALASALTEMVSNLTINKKKYEKVEKEMNEIRERAKKIRLDMLEKIEEDSSAFKKVMESFKLPKNTDEEKRKRIEEIQNSFINAAEVPLEVAKESYEILKLSEIVVEKGNKNAVTDGLVAAMLARTAVLSALLNVKINLESIKDEKYVEKTGETVKNLETMTIKKEAKILSKSYFEK